MAWSSSTPTHRYHPIEAFGKTRIDGILDRIAVRSRQTNASGRRALVRKVVVSQFVSLDGVVEDPSS